jgi:hypothetical protein
VIVPEDYASIPSLVLQTGRARQNPLHAISRNDFTQGDAFWLFLTQEGRMVGGAAACHYDLRGDDFDSFLRRTSAQQYGRADPIQHVARPVLDRLHGQLIYIGELQLHPDFRGKAPVLRAYAGMILALAALKWPFDAIYAIIPKAHRRLIEVYGFNWWVDHAITWRGTPPPGRRNDHILCGMTRVDFEHQWALPSIFAENEQA